MAEISKEKLEERFLVNPNKCPKCGSADLTWDEPGFKQSDHRIAEMHVACDDCELEVELTLQVLSASVSFPVDAGEELEDDEEFEEEEEEEDFDDE